MSAYIVIPVIVLTVMAIWFLVNKVFSRIGFCKRTSDKKLSNEMLKYVLHCMHYLMNYHFFQYMYDKRFKNTINSVYSSRPATTCPNVRQESIVYTISNESCSPPTNTNGTPDSGAEIRINQDGRAAPPPYGYTNQNLIAVSSIARDLPPSYDQVATTGHAPNNGPLT